MVVPTATLGRDGPVSGRKWKLTPLSRSCEGRMPTGVRKRYAVRTKPLARQTLRVLVGRGVLFDRCSHDAEGVFFWRCSIFGMLTIEPCSSLLPVEYRFKFQ